MGSHLLKYITDKMGQVYGSEAIAVTAPTGIAAAKVGGQTLHTFAGTGLGKAQSRDALVDKAVGNPFAVQRWMKTKVLIIDEVSMLDVYFFDVLDHIARQMKCMRDK